MRIVAVADSMVTRQLEGHRTGRQAPDLATMCRMRMCERESRSPNRDLTRQVWSSGVLTADTRETGSETREKKRGEVQVVDGHETAEVGFVVRRRERR